MSRNMQRVFSTREGKVLDVDPFLDGNSQEYNFKLRRAIKENVEDDALYLCASCFQPVLLRGSIHQELHFSHNRNSDDCPIKTTSNFTREQILAIKFNGQKEGYDHKTNKLLIADILGQDEAFDNVKVEKTFREENKYGVAKEWKRPDVMAEYIPNGNNVVFELQVSTTFLDVIIARETFYKRNNAFLMWVFLEFNPERFTTSDVCYSSFNHIFVFDDAAANKSKEEKSLHLTCYYLKPFKTDNNEIHENWTSELVAFGELTFDDLTKKFYFKDVEKMKLELMIELNKQNELDNNLVQLQQIRTEYLGKQELIANLEASKALLHSEVANLKEAASKSEVDLNLFDDKVKERKMKLDIINKEIVDARKAHNETFDLINRADTYVEAMRKEYRSTKSNVSNLERQLSSIMGGISAAEKRLKGINDEIARKQKELDRLNEDNRLKMSESIRLASHRKWGIA